MFEKGKKILIVGNGFDLAHGLPTKYIDFLGFCIRVEMLWKFKPIAQNKAYLEKSFQEKWIDKWDMENSIKDYIINAFKSRKYKYEGIPPQLNVKIEDEVFSELYELIHDNIWYLYFHQICKKNVSRVKTGLILKVKFDILYRKLMKILRI